MINRLRENAPPSLAFTKVEIHLLNYLKRDKKNPHSRNKKLSEYLLKVAKLGGYLARASDPPPGNTVMWRGLKRLVDIELGFNMAIKIVGN